jgi:cyclophilin family peptidyl-prolyl cis-trans isomerase
MTLASPLTRYRRLAALGLAAMLFAGCAQIPALTPAPTGTPLPTIPPTTPPFSLAPSPSGCPTSAPAPLSGTATVTMATNFGTIVIKVDAADGPNAAGAFVALARCGYYNNVVFHRIVKDFVIQAGDGTNAREPNIDWSKAGQGGPDWTIKDDPVTKNLVRGTVAVANRGADTGSSQFFIVLTDDAFPAGTTNYAIIGTVTQGMDVVDRIAQVPTGGEPEPGGAAGSGSMPLQPIVIESTTVTTP